MAAKLRPLDDRVVVEPVEAEEKTAGGIVLPDTAKEKPQRGTVRAVGPGRLLENGNRADLSVSVGDLVIYECPMSFFVIGSSSFVRHSDFEIRAFRKTFNSQTIPGA